MPARTPSSIDPVAWTDTASPARSAAAAALAYEASAGFTGFMAAATSGRVDHAWRWDSSIRMRASGRMGSPVGRVRTGYP